MPTNNIKEEQIKLGTKKIWVHKSIKNPNFESESVISDSPWLFVELWLKRNKKPKALSYWLQSKRFSEASRNASIEASPLLLYYSFLNATKSLLEVSGVQFKEHHGVTGKRDINAKANLVSEKITFSGAGILPSLCQYFNQTAAQKEYDMKCLLGNLPFVHRAFIHTYQSTGASFIPLEDVLYVTNENTNGAWFRARIAERYTDGRKLRFKVPDSFEYYKYECDGKTYINFKKKFTWAKGNLTQNKKNAALSNLKKYHIDIHTKIRIISRSRDLWYLKTKDSKNNALEEHGLVIMLAIMHRLSELSRYDPEGLNRHLEGVSNWLLSQFIELAPGQFIDQMAAEITGMQFWNTGILPLG